jgi:hypothetical protein
MKSFGVDAEWIPGTPHTGFPMSANLSRLRLFQRHLRNLVWVWVWVWDWIHSHTPPRTRSPSSRHPPFTHYPFPLRSLVCGGQPSPHKPRLVVSHSTCPPLSCSPHAHSFVLGTAVINTHTWRGALGIMDVRGEDISALGGLQIPWWLGSDPPMGWFITAGPSTKLFTWGGGGI